MNETQKDTKVAQIDSMVSRVMPYDPKSIDWQQLFLLLLVF
ncbi:Uncharacterised protein [Legionella pneumophila]|nr:hypothetical protein ULM_23620 [Legionella pneumophila]MDC8029291.1 hypothetical protein [Legionella pneumophila subsp. pneumophila]CZG07170.1 Uncharacterised protein [Legionella pneumophila]CZG33777.1 Uncharacterised protein [Legionella pneumophila]CZG40030.1 Uncharacterised protein [Legionella pneumophila]